MDKVWVVWANDYDGGQILGVADSQEVGEQIKADYFEKNPLSLYIRSDVEIDEWDITRGAPQPTRVNLVDHPTKPVG